MRGLRNCDSTTPVRKAMITSIVNQPIVIDPRSFVGEEVTVAHLTTSGISVPSGARDKCRRETTGKAELGLLKTVAVGGPRTKPLHGGNRSHNFKTFASGPRFLANPSWASRVFG